MGSKATTVAIVVILIVAFIYIERHGSVVTSTTTSSSSTTTTTSSSSTSTMMTTNSGMTFAANDQSISYGIPAYKDNAQVQTADVSMLSSTGVSCIRTDIGYAPWLKGDTATQSVVTQAVDGIKSGHCLIMADAGSESYRNGGCLNWAQFKAAWVQRVSTLAGLYHPDYYIVVKEPGWYVPMVCDHSTNPLFQSVTDWLGLTQNLTNAVEAASSNTVVGVAIAADSLNGANGAFYAQYLNQVQASFIGFDIYTSTGQAATTNYLTANPPREQVWIAEAWSQPTPTGSGQAQSDAAWMKAIDLYAQQIHAYMVIPFYTDLFSGYSVPTTTSGLITFYQAGLVTPVGVEFKNAVAGNP